MDTKNPTQQDPTTPISTVQQINDQQPAQQVPQPQQPSSPISGGNKEHGPIGSGKVAEYVAPHPSEATPELPQEVKEAGVEASPNVEQPGIPEEAKQAGVSHAKETVPVTVSDQAPTPQPVQLPTPMNYEEAKKEVSQGNPTNSKTWLGMLSKYVLEKFGMQKAA